jgi:hypothetical protein
MEGILSESGMKYVCIGKENFLKLRNMLSGFHYRNCIVNFRIFNIRGYRIRSGLFMDFKNSKIY